jgi:lysophospholipid acyltransferase (LPLAT)-like uncharacterized protein
VKLHSPFLFKLGGLLGATGLRHWMATLDYKAAYYDWAVDPVFPECRENRIYIFWHEYILLPFYLRGNCNISMLLSRHQDAEVLSHAARLMGFSFVRGSTNRGAVTAIRKLARASQSLHLTITPDGPRGPRRRMAMGPIYLASKLRMPLVALGFGCDRPWRFQKAWDKFVIPRPFSRARMILSSDIHVPHDLDRDGMEHYRRQVEDVITRLTLEAESWAESGTRKIEQAKLRRTGAPLMSRRAA